MRISAPIACDVAIPPISFLAEYSLMSGFGACFEVHKAKALHYHTNAISRRESQLIWVGVPCQSD